MGNTTCAQCGVVFGLPDHLEEARRDDHETFYCPNGHSLVFSSPSKNERRIAALEAELREERAYHTQHFHELIADRDAEHALARTCPICGEKPAAKVRIPENVTQRMADHLRDEHGARARLRSLPPGETASGA